MAGRRRGRELESAIFSATWQELSERGYQLLSIGAVAERSGTSKPVIYRRWRDRADLVAATLRDRLPTGDEAPDTGSLRGDLIGLLTLVADRQPTAETIWGLLAETARTPGRLAEVHSLLSIVDKHGPMMTLLARAVERDEIPRLPAPRIITLPVDLLRSEILVAGRISPEVITSIVDEIVLPLLSRRTSSTR